MHAGTRGPLRGARGAARARRAASAALAVLALAGACGAAPGGDENTGVFWHLTDAHLSPQRLYGPCAAGAGGGTAYGSYACDAPAALVQGTLRWMAAERPRPDFVAYTGDDPPHAPWNEMTRSWVYGAMANVSEWTAAAFGGRGAVPVLPCLGNHESYPHDQVAPGGPLLNYTAALWRRAFGLPEGAAATVRRGGYYAVPLPGRPGLRVVSLNTVLWYTDNNATSGQADPGGQMAWLNRTLSAAEAAGERVFVLSHVPPGVDERSGAPHLRARFNRPYVALLRRFRATIAAQLAGHEHSDSFRVDGPLLAPSLTPWHNHWVPSSLPNNPGVRLFSYDRGTGRPLDYSQFWLNLAALPAGGAPAALPPWRVEYNATALYAGLPPGPAATLSRWRLLSEDLGAFDRYMGANLVGYPEGRPCRGACRARHLCAIRHVDLDEYAACVASARAV